jgi:nitroreductase
VAAYFSLLANALYDARRYAKHSGLLRHRASKRTLQARITKGYHSIEKGLALPNPRPGFGEARIRWLIELTEHYAARFGKDGLTDIVTNCLGAYEEFSEKLGCLNPTLRGRIDGFRTALSRPHSELAGGGVLQVSRHEILADCRIDAEKFFRSRHSVRQFSKEAVSVSSIQQAVALAQRSPSVCNRQPARVHLLTARKDIDECLECQGGADGFVPYIDKLLVCTAEIGQMVTVGERNQCWTDGGMYAMSLVYALHAIGLGTCCLNWSKTKRADALLRRRLALSDSECIVVLIAVGNMPEEFAVTQSPRLSVDSVLTVHTSR